MSADRLRVILIALLAFAAVLGVVGHKAGSPWIVWVSYACFVVAVAVYLRWRQGIRARVLDREEKTAQGD
ncbi:MAG TPA: hypothetical protein VG652_08775 [Gaiellaceae bacterium]|nr:hypothetical protein [Gaiellaceae bacterium]